MKISQSTVDSQQSNDCSSESAAKRQLWTKACWYREGGCSLKRTSLTTSVVGNGIANLCRWHQSRRSRWAYLRNQEELGGGVRTRRNRNFWGRSVSILKLEETRYPLYVEQHSNCNLLCPLMACQHSLVAFTERIYDPVFSVLSFAFVQVAFAKAKNSSWPHQATLDRQATVPPKSLTTTAMATANGELSMSATTLGNERSCRQTDRIRIITNASL